MVNNMTTFREKVLENYIPGLYYKSRSTGATRKLQCIRTHICGDRCRGSFGICDGTQLIFADGIAGCVFDLDENIRFELATEVILQTNVRW